MDSVEEEVTERLVGIFEFSIADSKSIPRGILSKMLCIGPWLLKVAVA